MSPSLGVLMLDTRFPRLPGDAGHPASWAMPVRFAVVRGASPQRVVRAGDPSLLRPFVEAGRVLAAQGAQALTTSCGFLALFQSELEAALPVPVWTSSLLQVGELAAAGHRPGVITVDAASLGERHWRAAGASPDTPVEGLEPGGSLQRTLLENRRGLDVEAARAQTVAAARRLVARHPEVDVVVLECTNLPPYADAVRAAVGRPVHHLVSFVHQCWAARGAAEHR